MPTCARDGCNERRIPSYAWTVDLCRSHADEVLAGPCAVPGCERPVVAVMLQLCRRHRGALVRHGDVNGNVRRPYLSPPPPCAFGGCDKPAARLNGLCLGHNRQQERGSTLRPLRRAAPPGSIKPYIEAVLAERDRTAGCWLDWPHGKSDGRPTMRHDGRRIMVACYLVLIEHGALPEYACHTCDNGACWNPDHIYPGTAKSNAEDRERRRRGRNQYGPRLRDRV